MLPKVSSSLLCFESERLRLKGVQCRKNTRSLFRRKNKKESHSSGAGYHRIAT